ncbi:MAG: hypothetical protein VB138_06390 [Burkholderia sp.]
MEGFGGRAIGGGLGRSLVDGRAFCGNLVCGGACGARFLAGGPGGVCRRPRGPDELIDARTERVDLVVQVHACLLYV